MAKAKVPNIYTQTVQQTEQLRQITETGQEDPIEEQGRGEDQERAAQARAPKGRILKQAAFAIGSERERKLDRLAFAYNEQQGTRINRNDIIRFLIDRLTIDELLAVDLLAYKK